MTEIAWRMFHAGNPDTPVAGLPPTHPAGKLPLTRENARLYARSIVETVFAGQPGQDAWHALFGGDAAATVLIEITAPSELAGRYEVDLSRSISVACARRFRGPEEQPAGSGQRVYARDAGYPLDVNFEIPLSGPDRAWRAGDPVRSMARPRLPARDCFFEGPEC